MAFLTLLSIAENMPDPTGFWQFFIFKVFDFVVHYGWRIIVFTVCLKLILSPLDIYQRFVMRKNERIKKRIQPDLDKLEAQYGNNRTLLQQKTMELNKREGFSYASTCILAIVPLIIFITLWPGLTSISQYMYTKQYLQFVDVYDAKYEQVLEQVIDDNNLVWNEESEQYDIKDYEGNSVDMRIQINELLKGVRDEAQTAVEDFYKDNKVGFIWIKNIWSPDVPWKKPILNYTEFKTAIGKYGSDPSRTGMSTAQMNEVFSRYDDVTYKLRASDENKVNGLLILPILSVGLSFLSQFLMGRQQKKSGMAPTGGQGASTMKMMMFMMPIMMGFFALQYTSVFTIYIVTNSVLTLIINLSSTSILKFIDSYNENRARYIKKTAKEEPQIMRYGRPDPNASNGADEKNSKKKGK